MKQCRILIVDDEPFVVDWIAGLLEDDSAARYEYDICRAYNADEALRWFMRARIDVMVSDIRMPSMSGIELARKIVSCWPVCKVLFLTAYAQFDYAYQAMELGIAGYILKNEDDHEILAKIHRAIDLLDNGRDLSDPPAPVPESALFGALLAGTRSAAQTVEDLGWSGGRFCLVTVGGTLSTAFRAGVCHVMTLLGGRWVYAASDGAEWYLLCCSEDENAAVRLGSMLEWVQQNEKGVAGCLISPMLAAGDIDTALSRSRTLLQGLQRDCIFSYTLDDAPGLLDKRTIRFIQSFVRENVCQDVSLIRIAEVTGYNPSYLSRFYKESTGTLLSRFISDVKMDYIRRMMSDTQMDLGEIAVRCGFKSRTYFNRFVKKQTGLPPQNLLRQIRG